MDRALKGVPITEPKVPAGVVNVGGDWFYEEYARSGVPSLGLEDKGSSTTPLAAPPQQPAAEERNRILDLFKN
jgi:penicillin-binding protein 1A